MKRKIVLGAGPIGLISTYMLKADCVLGYKFGGNDLVRTISPNYIWRTEETKRFLNELKFNWKPKDIKFGWLLPDGKIENIATVGQRTDYYLKSRNIKLTDCVDEWFTVPKSIASSNKPGVIKTFNVSVDDLVNRLSNFVNWIKVDIREIDYDFVNYTVMINRKLIVDQIINTLPAPTWNSVNSKYFLNKKWNSGSKCWVVGGAYNSLLHNEWSKNDKQFLYCVDPKIPFDRVTFLRNDCSHNRFSYEFNSKRPSPNFTKNVSGVIVPYGNYQINGRFRVPDSLNGMVRHVGRFAHWDHSIRIHDVIKELYGQTFKNN